MTDEEKVVPPVALGYLDDKSKHRTPAIGTISVICVLSWCIVGLIGVAILMMSRQ